MKKSLLLSLRKHLVRVPRPIWQAEVDHSAKNAHHRLGFMSEDHHRVRDFVVLELPRLGTPIPAQVISDQLNLDLPRTEAILAELEKGMTFLYRNPKGDVVWAYPVTVEPTPHRIRFSTGEQIYAACAIDAIATPFVQGQLRKEHLTCQVDTVCAHCNQSIAIEIDSDLHYKISTAGANPLVFAPMVDFDRLEDPSIIDAF